MVVLGRRLRGASHRPGPERRRLGAADPIEAFFSASGRSARSGCAGSPIPWAWRLGVPALWAIRGVVAAVGALGLSWGDLAYTQHLALPILQVTKLTGIWGLAFLIVLVNVALAEVSRRTRLEPSLRLPLGRGSGRPGSWSNLPSGSGEPEGGLPARLALPLLTPALVALALVYGFVDDPHRAICGPTLSPPRCKGTSTRTSTRTRPMSSGCCRHSRRKAGKRRRRGAALTVWPETAYPGYLLSTRTGPRAQVAAEAVRSRQVMIIGGVEHDSERAQRRQQPVFDGARGEITGSYQKRQLVPFGEFVPGRRWMPFLEALHVTTFDMKPGRRHAAAAGRRAGRRQNRSGDLL